MLHPLIAHNDDLTRLYNDGYEISICDGYLRIDSVPYLNASKQVKYGSLLAALELSVDSRTVPPSEHTVLFSGDEFPCYLDGTMIEGIRCEFKDEYPLPDFHCRFRFSSKPAMGYRDNYAKYTQYILIMSGSASIVDPSVTPRTFKVIDSELSSVFNYYDTNAARSSVVNISRKLQNEKIGIIGVGGTGSYVLDFIAKTPVAEIHLFDGDNYLLHNAFRSPGAPSKDEFNQTKAKVDYYHYIYRRMHKGIVPHSEHILVENMALLEGMSFVFLCIDKGSAKRPIIEYLKAHNIPFIDTGIGVHKIDTSLIGAVRVTTVTPQMNSHVDQRIQMIDDDNDAYSTNIQIAELNALNAVQAVIKWKKLRGFYHDAVEENHSVYTINTGLVSNEDYIL